VGSAGLVGAGADVEELALAGVDAGAVARGLAFTDGRAELGGQVVPVALAVGLLSVTLVLCFAGAVVLSLAVAGEVVVLVIPVVGAVAVPVAVPVEETLSPGLLLVLVAVGLTGLAGVVVVGVGTGLAGSVGLASADDVELDGHTVTGTLL
jgi:hypothetical protein